MDENRNYFNKNKGKVFLVGMLSGILISLLAAGGTFALWKWKGIINQGQSQIQIQGQNQNQGQNQSNADTAEPKTNSALNESVIAKIRTLEETIDSYFYLRDVTDEEMQNGLYRGLLAALDDPYSEYYTAEELTSMMEHTQGIYYGIGAYVQMDTKAGVPKISGVIANSPAEEADLRANDLIYEVDGVSTSGLTLTEAVALIKGPEGTEVELTLFREGESDYRKEKLTRRKVESPTVECTLEEDIAKIVVTEFDDVTVPQFAEALATAKLSGAKGIILDLRGNPGGNLSAVVDMCNMILPKGMIVYTEDNTGNREEYKSDGKNPLSLPLVVLVDMNSASAAEIMAGAIQDYGIGTLVGTTTFGKGIVQKILPLQDGSAVKITVSAYYTPKGNNIHGIGIKPDVECAFDSEAYYGSEDRPDNQLEKAKEVLREKIGK